MVLSTAIQLDGNHFINIWYRSFGNFVGKCGIQILIKSSQETIHGEISRMDFSKFGHTL